MTATWIVIGLGSAAAVAIVIASWRRRQYVSDLGTVSAQWMSEQRMSAQHDSHR